MTETQLLNIHSCHKGRELNELKGSGWLCKIVELRSRSFERRICAQTQDLQIFKKFNMSQMNPKEALHGHSL